jgi:hypothetical protein
MPDLYGNDAAESAASPHPEVAIAEVRLRNVPIAHQDPAPRRSTRPGLVLALGLVVLVVAAASVVARLLGN